mgnify:CR=1 FL=1
MKLLIYTLVLLMLTSPLWAVGVEVGSNCEIFWTAPTKNTDGTAITNLAGYNLFAGTAPGAYGPALFIAAPTTTITCKAAGIVTTGQKYITITALNTVKNESAKHTEVPFFLSASTPEGAAGLSVK